MRYDYNSELECFVREDGLGKKIWINSSEAQRIVTMRDLGYSIAKINAKIDFNSDKVYESTIVNFLKNVDEGNIIVNGDYPAPKKMVDDLTVSDRITNLEKRISDLEDMIEDIMNTDDSWGNKVKSWLKR